MPTPLAGSWSALPETLRQRLALASTGWRHLALAGAQCLRLARAEGGADEKARLYALAADILLWAFGENPLSGPLAAEILGTADLPLSGAARAGLSAVAGRWRMPEPKQGGLAYFERLAQKRDTQKLAEFLAAQVAKDPGGLFWREKALALALYCGEAELSRTLESAALEGLSAMPGLAPAARILSAQSAFLRGDAEFCLDELLSALHPLQEAYGPAFAAARAGLALLAAGEDAAALPLLRDCLRAAPWQAGLAQVAADAESGLRHQFAPVPGPALVMLYSWNKADDLDATLASLAASDLSTEEGGRARIMVLDNGSTDRTAQAAETLIYLDDDVTLPPDWLQRLGAALRAHPDAGVVGCKVADHQAPHLLQNVAGHLVIPPDATEDRPDVDFHSPTPNPFRLCDAHLQGPDWGLFDFIGPCASVTGCCHLFRRAAFDAVGSFSLALAPSQYDDFERDLRMLGKGLGAVCQGHLRVRHRKRSGLAAQGSQGQEGEASSNAQGNRYKMQTMHSREEIAGFIAAQAQRLGEAAAGAFALLDRTGDPT